MPAVSQINLNELESFAKNDDVTVVGIFAPDSKEAEEFKKVAEALRNEHAYASIQPGVYMVKKFDEGFAKYTGDIKAESLTKWINAESMPLMAEVSPENYAKYMSAGLPMMYLFYEKEAMRNEYGPMVEEAVKPFKGKINAVYIDAEKFEAHAKALTLPNKWPGIVIHEMDNDLKFPFNGKIEKGELGKFVKEYVEGKLEPTYRSEDIPEKDEGPVKTIVYKNFEKIVMDEGKDVLLELYAPWCGACKRISPIYEALAKAYAPHSDKVVIAKMDGTANDLPKSANVKLTKFPTIILFKAGKKKEQVEFEQAGDTVAKFVEFVSTNGTHKLSVKVEEPKASASDKDEL
jgi:protein disulfide-isomerase A1